MRPSLPTSYFDDVYRANADPWGFATSPYETAKYDATLAALPDSRYGRALELGCAIGVLTVRLAERCDFLLSLDVAEAALAQARARCVGRANVRFERRAVPAEFPGEREGDDPSPWDLILVSEVGYYLSLKDLRRLRGQITGSLRPGGDLLLVHWTPFVQDYPLTGDQVHECFLELSGRQAEDGGSLTHVRGVREEKYRLDLFRRRQPPPPRHPTRRRFRPSPSRRPTPPTSAPARGVPRSP